MKINVTNLVEDHFVLLIILFWILLIGRGIYITNHAKYYSCPKGETVTIDYLALPIIQSAVECDTSP